MLKIKMDKTQQKVKKDPKRQGALRKCREQYMNELKERISNYEIKGCENTSNASNDAASAATKATSSADGGITGSSDIHICWVDVVAALAKGPCMYLHITRNSQNL